MPLAADDVESSVKINDVIPKDTFDIQVNNMYVCHKIYSNNVARCA